jgi:hypothetical protein
MDGGLIYGLRPLRKHHGNFLRSQLAFLISTVTGVAARILCEYLCPAVGSGGLPHIAGR